MQNKKNFLLLISEVSPAASQFGNVFFATEQTFPESFKHNLNNQLCEKNCKASGCFTAWVCSIESSLPPNARISCIASPSLLPGKKLSCPCITQTQDFIGIIQGETARCGWNNKKAPHLKIILPKLIWKAQHVYKSFFFYYMLIHTDKHPHWCSFLQYLWVNFPLISGCISGIDVTLDLSDKICARPTDTSLTLRLTFTF